MTRGMATGGSVRNTLGCLRLTLPRSKAGALRAQPCSAAVGSAALLAGGERSRPLKLRPFVSVPHGARRAAGPSSTMPRNLSNMASAAGGWYWGTCNGDGIARTGRRGGGMMGCVSAGTTRDTQAVREGLPGPCKEHTSPRIHSPCVHCRQPSAACEGNTTCHRGRGIRWKRSESFRVSQHAHTLRSSRFSMPKAHSASAGAISGRDMHRHSRGT